MEKLRRMIPRAAAMLLLMLLTTTTAWALEGGVNYIDANGVLKNTKTDDIDGNDSPTVLTGNETNLSAGWYLVTDNLSYTSQIRYSGNVHLILADGVTMKVGTSDSRITGNAIDATSYDAVLTIYGQSTGNNMGTLSVYATVDNDSQKNCINGSSLVFNGGHIIANTTGDVALYAYNGDITINGGIIEATTINNGSDYPASILAYNITLNGGTVSAPGIYANKPNSTLTLGGSTVTTNSLYAFRSIIKVADGLIYTDGTTTYSGKLCDESDNTRGEGKYGTDFHALNTDINGKTLKAYNGTCGTNVTWSFANETLTISGTGAMDDYTSNEWETNQPWRSFSDNIKNVVVEDGVTHIGNSAFECLNKVQHLTIGKDVETIGYYACKRCSLRVSVTIPPSVTKIGNGAFADNDMLPKVYVLPTTVPTLGADAFGGYHFNGFDIYVPSAKEADYEAATGWTTYAEKINPVYAVTADPVANMTLTGNVGVQYGSTVYAANGETVSLTMTDPSNPPAGYSSIDGHYRVVSQTLEPDEGVYKVTISGQDVFITAFTAITYSITYHAGEGATFSTTTNTNYNILCNDITLDTPTKEGWTFCGWYTNENLTGDPVTTIPAGSTGDKEYWAKWMYGITYNLNGGTVTAPEKWVIKATLNKHVSSDDFGFKINGEEYAHYVFSTPSDDTGLDYYYTYEGAQPSTIEFLHYNSGSPRTSGSLAFNPNGGSFSISNKDITGSYTVSHYANPTTYIAESPSFTLNMPEKDGCYFTGWTGTGLSEPTKEVTITTGSTGNREYTATWVELINISTCEASVPDQMLDGSYIGYKFSAANEGNATIGEEVKNGNTVLTLGTDYEFGDVYFYGTTNPSTDVENKIGDHFTVEIRGIGVCTGTLEVDFYIGVSVKATAWGDLSWTLNKNGTLTITGTGAMNSSNSYPWYEYKNYINTITIGEGVTSVADYAFAPGQDGSYVVSEVNLPTSLKSIGEYAFDNCTGATISIPSGVTSIGLNAFREVLKVIGTLDEKADNTGLVSLLAGAKRVDVTVNRTLYKDNAWNTLCLPFGVDDIEHSTLAGATLMELDVDGYYDGNTRYIYKNGKYFKSDGEDGAASDEVVARLLQTGLDATTGTLRLYFKAVTSIEANKPYIIKWASGENITSMQFSDVSVISLMENATSADGKVTFKGTYDAVNYGAENKSILLVGGDNLYWPKNGASIKPFRAYFDLGTHEAREFVVNFGNDDIATSMLNAQCFMLNEADAWYSLDGRKLDKQPTKKGLYIHNGRKVVIK